MLKIGDKVKIINVTEDDILCGRKVGEVGIYLGDDPDFNDSARVLIPTYGIYLMYNSQIEPYAPRDIHSILQAFNCCCTDMELMISTITDFITETSILKDTASISIDGILSSEDYTKLKQPLESVNRPTIEGFKP